MKKLSLIRFIGDIVVLAFALVSLIWLFNSPVPHNFNKMEYLRYYTVLSNIAIGIVAGVALPFDAISLIKNDATPRLLKASYVVISASTTLTMLTVIFFLGPTMGYAFMYENYNIFMHLLTPLAALARVLLLESKENPMQFRDTFYAFIPTAIYGAFYVINCASHDGYGTVDYDWYNFGAAGLGVGILVLILMIGIAYGLAWITYFGQKKIHLA